MIARVPLQVPLETHREKRNMAYYSIEKRKTSKGELRYRCTAMVKKDGAIIYRERETFAKMSEAKSWGVIRVADLEKNGLPVAHQKNHAVWRVTRIVYESPEHQLQQKQSIHPQHHQ